MSDEPHFVNWYSAQEIADLALPEMPRTKRRINALAEREGWRKSQYARAISSSGGQVWQYQSQLFPKASRIELAQRMLAEGAPETPGGHGWIDTNISEAAAARLLVLQASSRFNHAVDLRQCDADELFCEMVAGGKVSFEDWVSAHIRAISPRTLRRWRSAANKGQPVEGDCRKNRKNTGFLERAENGAVKKEVLALLATNAFLTAEQIRGYCRQEFKDVIKWPSLRAFQMTISRWKCENRLTLTALTNPDRYKSAFEFAGNSTDCDVTRLNQLWEIDASPADILCVDGRKNLYACIDVWSRRVVVLVTDQPSAAGVALLLRKSLLQWGVPEIIKTDRGSDFTARTTKRLVASLDIVLDLLPAGQPKMKPHVERFFRTLQHGFINTLPGFIGHDVGMRKIIEEKKSFLARRGDDDFTTFKADLTAEELQSYINDWLVNIYEQRRHGGIGMPPALKAGQFAGEIREIKNIRALDLLLAPIAGSDGIRVVTKKGIRLEGEYYFTSAAMPGARVFCRHDPEDQGRLYLYDEDSEDYLGDAVCPRLAGLDPAEVLKEVKSAQRTEINRAKSEIRSARRKIKPRDVADAVRGSSPEIIPFVRPGVEHCTNSLDVAASTLEGSAKNPAKDAEIAAITEELNDNIAPLRTVEAPFDRYARAKKIEEALEGDHEVASDDAHWFGVYSQGAEWRGFERLYGSEIIKEEA